MITSRIILIRNICKFLPPILSHRFHQKFLKIKDTERMAFNFQAKSVVGGIFHGNTKDFLASTFFIHGYFDWRLIVLAKKILKTHIGNIIEVGANIGTETVSLARINKKAKVYAFEPVPENFQNLVRIKQDNSFDNLIIYQEVVSERSGKIFFKLPGKSNSGLGFATQEKDESTKEYNVTSLDDTLGEIPSCSVIIIDVEGFEFKVIKGAEKIINKFRPFLIIEVNADYLSKRGGISLITFYERLSEMGYSCFYIDAVGLRQVEISDFRKKSNKNWLCIPKERVNEKARLSFNILFNALNPFFKFKMI